MAQFPGPNGTTWHLKILWKFGRTILASSCEMKKKLKRVTSIVAFHFMKRRLKRAKYLKASRTSARKDFLNLKTLFPRTP